MKIVEAGPEWAERYRLFCQAAYLHYYVRPELGITEDLYSDRIFATDRVKEYFASMFERREDQRAWLALKDDKILGGIVAKRFPEYCEIKAFYVAPDKKGQGIGHALYEKALEFAAGMEMRLDVVNYMKETIHTYEHWGFHIDEGKGYIEYPWEGWPEHARHAHRGIFMVRPAGN